MKKLLFISFLAVIIVTLMGGVALAGGWTSVDYNESQDHDDDGATGGIAGDGAYWNPDEAELIVGQRSPHGNFSSSTNQCRVCHAVHMAGSNSWRLLRDGSTAAQNGIEDRGIDRASECNYCHGVSGATKKRPWRPKAFEVKGEHTLGSTIIPDAVGGTLGPKGLSCGNCHTVHGADSLSAAETAADFGTTLTAGAWANKILKQDPNQDGNKLALTFDGRSSTTSMENDAYATLSNFCGDCHNQNPNWNTSEDATQESPRANPMSHVQGPTADGQLEVYGTTTTVANWGSKTTEHNGAGTAATPQNTQRGCRGCHAAETEGNVSTGSYYTAGTDTATKSAWPHQTKGAKLLFDTYTQDNVVQQAANTNGWGSLTNDASRVLPRMDQLCAKCHRNSADIDNSTAGVGQTF